MIKGSHGNERTQQPTKPAKYGNRKQTIDGQTFDSQAEAAYYQHLKLAQKAGGWVTAFECQPKYVLVDKFKHPQTGKTVRAITYTADFLVTYQDGSKQIIDVKGAQTPVFKLKAKLFMHRYGVPLVLAKRTGHGFAHTTV